MAWTELDRQLKSRRYYDPETGHTALDARLGMLHYEVEGALEPVDLSLTRVNNAAFNGFRISNSSPWDYAIG